METVMWGIFYFPFHHGNTQSPENTAKARGTCPQVPCAAEQAICPAWVLLVPRAAIPELPRLLAAGTTSFCSTRKSKGQLAN